MSMIAAWAVTLIICDSEKLVMAPKMVAPPTASARGHNMSNWFSAKTVSIRYLDP